MVNRWGLGPVFVYECLAAARRWQVYASRVLLVGGLLAGLALVWYTRVPDDVVTFINQRARVGSAFLDAILGVELVLALVVVPAATAGAVCHDKMSGALALMMVTDLSDAEIVFGKLASRLAAVLGVVACGLPVLAIATSLGGVDPGETLGATMVVVGVAVLGVSVTMTYSVWATRAHEALMATYATWAVWLLALIAWSETWWSTTPFILYATNPFWLLFGMRWFGPGASAYPVYHPAFFAGCLAVSGVLAAVAAWRLRPVTLRQAGRTPRAGVGRIARAGAWLHRLGLRDVSLDDDPVLWREHHRSRPTVWARAIWGLYFGLTLTFTLLAIFVNPDMAVGVGGFTVAIGLLMVSVTSATALAEERSHGSLDVLMATPLSSREIVMGKWRGSFRFVPRLAVLPGLLGVGVAVVCGRWWIAGPFAVMSVLQVLAYGACVTSLGLALATWQPRLSRAVALCVGCYLGAAVIYPTIVIVAVQVGPDDVLLLGPSPFFGPYTSHFRLRWGTPDQAWSGLLAMAVGVALMWAVAYLLLRATLRSFDRRLGRVGEHDGPRSIFRNLPSPNKVILAAKNSLS